MNEQVSNHTMKLLHMLPYEVGQTLANNTEYPTGWLVDNNGKAVARFEGMAVTMHGDIRILPVDIMTILDVAVGIVNDQQKTTTAAWEAESYIFEILWGSDAVGLRNGKLKELEPSGSIMQTTVGAQHFPSKEDMRRWMALSLLAQACGLEIAAPNTCWRCGDTPELIPGYGYTCPCRPGPDTLEG